MALTLSKDSILAFENPHFTRMLLFNLELNILPVDLQLQEKIGGEHLYIEDNSLFVWGGSEFRESRIEKINMLTGKSTWSHFIMDATDHIAIHSIKSLLAVGSGMNQIDILDLNSGKLLNRFSWIGKCENTVFDILGFSESGDSIFLCCSDKICEKNLADLGEKTLIVPEWTGYDFWIQDNMLRTLNNHDVNRSQKLSCHVHSITTRGHTLTYDSHVTVSNLGHTLAVHNNPQSTIAFITLIDSHDGAIIGEFNLDHSGYIISMAIDDNTKRLFVEFDSDRVIYINFGSERITYGELNLDEGTLFN